MKLSIFLLLMGMSALCEAQIKKPFIETSVYFEFYSNYWINLHHFLYQKAKGSQLEHLQEDGNAFLEIGENAVYKKLNNSDSEKLDRAIEYYRAHIIDKSLFRLGDLRVWLQGQDPGGTISDTTFSKELTDLLNTVSSVYRNHFWPTHDKQNRKVLASHKEMILELEESVIGELERLSGDT